MTGHWSDDPVWDGWRLSVAAPVPRDDGRFYVPVTINAERENLSPIVLRVASDAFSTVEEAEAFGKELAARWNSFG